MKSYWDSRQQRLVPAGNAKSEHDALPLPGGRTVASASNSELETLFVNLGIPGASHSNGRRCEIPRPGGHGRPCCRRSGSQRRVTEDDSRETAKLRDDDR